MVGKLIFGIVGIAALVGCATVPGKRTVDEADLAIIGVTVIPMTEGSTVLVDQTVLINDGRIASIGTRSGVRVPASARRIEGRGRFLMPGLTDSHVHLEYIEDPTVLKLFVANGVTSVRSMDGRPYILDWRRQVEERSLVGPRIVTAGPIIDGSPPLRADNLAVKDASAARAAVSEQASRGYDFIKLYTNISSEAFDGALAEARRLGLPVVGHVPKAVPLDRAAGSLLSIEHLGDFAGAVATEGGEPIPGWARRMLAAPLAPVRLESLGRKLAEAKVWVVPTLIQQDRSLAPASEVEKWAAESAISHLPRPVLDQWHGANARFSGRLDAGDWALVERARLNRLAVLAALHKAGVPLAVGTDTPNPFVAMGASVHQELANFVAAGLSPVEALRAATLAPAHMMGLAREQGTVETGKRADLLLLARNPLLDVANADDRVGLLLRGRWFSKADLETLARDFARSQAQKPQN